MEGAHNLCVDFHLPPNDRRVAHPGHVPNQYSATRLAKGAFEISTVQVKLGLEFAAYGSGSILSPAMFPEAGLQ